MKHLRMRLSSLLSEGKWNNIYAR